MSNDEAVEVVAKALRNYIDLYWVDLPGWWDDEDEAVDASTNLAQSAIDTLRKMGWGPTDERVNAWLLLVERLLAAAGKEDEAMEVRQYRIEDARQRSNE